MELSASPFRLTVIAAFAVFLAGCGSSAREHVEKPLTSRPSSNANDFDRLTTPEAKIQYIQSSKAPEREKQQAIEMIKSGKL